MKAETTYFIKYDADHVRLKINKGNVKCFAICFILVFVLFEKTFIQIGMPSFIIYIIDLVNIYLLLMTVGKERWKQFWPMLVMYIFILCTGILSAFVNYSQWGGNPLFTLIEIRNIVRFPIFFISCVVFLDQSYIEKIFRILTIYFYVNSVYILYQYFTYHPPGSWTRGDYLNGFFGVATGGNTFVNVLMLCVVAYWMCQWAKKRCEMRTFLIPFVVSVAIAGLIELKAYFFEVALLYIWYFISQRKGLKTVLKNIVIIIVVVVVGYIALQYMYKEYPWFRGNMSLVGMLTSIMDSSGYTGSGDLNRLTAVFTIAGEIFHGSLTEILLGIGVGNGATYALDGVITKFNALYASTHYSWFSSGYVFVQCGAIGLISYLGTFAYLFCRKKNKEYSVLAQTMAMLAVVLIFYGEALKTDAGYFVYFALACGFVRDKSLSLGQADNVSES